MADETWLKVATAVAKRAKCTRSQVGAALLSADKRKLWVGRNGVPAGEVSCTDGGCPRGKLSAEECAPYSSYSNCKAIHAEDNALRKAGLAARGAVMYVTREPCEDCYALLWDAGIDSVVWLQSAQIHRKVIADTLRSGHEVVSP